MQIFTSEPICENNSGIIVFEEPFSPVAEAYRRIKVSIEFSSEESGINVVQFCSASDCEAKTNLLLNLAATFIEEGKKAVIVDLNLREPKIHSAFGGDGKIGLAEFLSDKIPLEETICHTERGIDYITRGENVGAPSALLGSSSLKNLFKELKRLYSVVLVDCPSVLSVSDCCMSARLCDGTFFVISQSKTSKKEAKNAITILKRNKVNILGCIFCDVDDRAKF